MAKTTAKSKTTKTDKPATDKKTSAAKADSAKKKPAAKKTSSETGTATKKAPAKKAATNKTGSRTTDPGAALAKQCQQVADKFAKMDDGKYTEIKEKLEWCLGSYHYDKNPDGLVNYGKQAVDKLKEAREEKPRSVSQKVIDDLEKALAKF